MRKAVKTACKPLESPWSEMNGDGCQNRQGTVEADGRDSAHSSPFKNMNSVPIASAKYPGNDASRSPPILKNSRDCRRRPFVLIWVAPDFLAFLVRAVSPNDQLDDRAGPSEAAALETTVIAGF
jgi:hypothetical protein